MTKNRPYEDILCVRGSWYMTRTVPVWRPTGMVPVTQYYCTRTGWFYSLAVNGTGFNSREELEAFIAAKVITGEWA